MSLLPTDCREDIEQAVREMHEAIDEALGYIERREDGPLTMRAALKEIRERLDGIETEIAILLGSAARLQIIAAQLRNQRDAAIEQRDTVIELVNRDARRRAGKTTNPPP